MMATDRLVGAWKGVRVKRRNAVLLAIAVIWAAVIFTVSGVVEGTPASGKVLTLVGGGVAATLIVVGGGLRGR